ncbi:phosphatase PAP2 family protein [Schaalia vaccimaxillae]|uniref:phosphatase PAP2 family protein n=1 Tax=Schaalia vaccimaxillae TaxID=183916 RepID=UPI0003B6058D|nr:phosphatase PAP2 family protein [Schaalia vaccimaxillae]
MMNDGDFSSVDPSLSATFTPGVNPAGMPGLGVSSPASESSDAREVKSSQRRPADVRPRGQAARAGNGRNDSAPTNLAEPDPEATDVIASDSHISAGSSAGRSRSRPSADQEVRASGRPRSTTISVDAAWYRRRLVRRLFGAVLCVVGVVATSYVAVSTRTGQAIDTVFMEAIMRWSEHAGGFGALMTGIVSVPAIVLVAVVVALIAAIRRRPTLAGRALSMVVLANASTQLLKLVIDRPNLGITTAVGNSLPSGHVTVAVSISLALVVIAPQWLRAPAAWAGWLWTSLMGVSVMMSAWHRIADVVAAVLVCGVWALLLTPIEHRRRHAPIMHRAMVIIALVAGVAAVALAAGALFGVDLAAVATPGGSGYGFSAFLAAHPTRAGLLAVSGSLGLFAVVGLVIHEVDRLCTD